MTQLRGVVAGLKRSRGFYLSISLLVATFFSFAANSNADASRYWEESRCFSLIGQYAVDSGFDVNGNERCDDREVRVSILDFPPSIIGEMLLADRDALCVVTTSDGEPAAFLGYSASGEFRGLYEHLEELPLDGTVFPGGLNGDGDCNDRETYREDFTEIAYFALGDSVASGHGLMDDGSTCRRSQQSYPYLVAELLRQEFSKVYFPDSHHLACSGATTDDGNNERSLNYQVQRVLEQLDDTPTLVSFTIGANDFEWSNPAKFSNHLYVERSSTFKNWAEKTASNVESNLSKAIENLLAYDNVFIILTEYHNPFNSDSVFFLSPVPGLCAFRDCFQRTEHGVNALNTALANVVYQHDRSRISITEGLHEAFSEHESPSPSCGNDGPDVSETWVQYRTDPDSNSSPGIANWFGDRYGDWQGDCFHPNFAGAKQFANFTYQAVRQLHDLTP